MSDADCDDNYAREYVGEPMPLSAEYRFAYECWLEYYDRCEGYDRTVCTGPMGRDGVMPVNPEQRAIINRHAANLSKLVNLKLIEVDADTSRRGRAKALNAHTNGVSPRTHHLVILP